MSGNSKNLAVAIGVLVGSTIMLVSAVQAQENNAPKPEMPTGASSTAAPQVPNCEPNYLADITKNGAAKWPASRMPIKVFIKAPDQLKGYRPSFQPLLKQAFDEWTAATNGLIRFSIVPTSQQADIVCTWTDDQSKMIWKEEDGQAILIPDAQGILRAEILLLSNSPTGAAMTDAYEKRVCLHEVGHAIGISGHSPDASDIMYRTSSPDCSDSHISTRDRNTAIALYTVDLKSTPQLSDNPTSLPAGASAQTQAMKLSNDAVVLLKNKQPEQALKKLEEAHKLDPKNQLINSNLGGLYANYAAVATMLRNFPVADGFFSKAIPLLEQSPNKSALAGVLQSYASVLHLMNKEPQAFEMEKRARAMQSGK